MSDTSLFIPVLLGTNRDGRQSENVAHFLVNEITSRDGMDAKLFDVRNFSFPTDDYGESIKDMNNDWRKAVLAADGLALVCPEYNHSFPGSLKSALDTLLKEYIHKPVGLVGVSSGPWGGTRGIESLVNVVRELGLVTSSVDLNFPKVKEAFTDDGELTDEAYRDRAKKFLDELEWLGTTLRWGRENIESDL